MKRPTPRPRRSMAPRRSPTPTPRPRNAQAIMAGQRGNRAAQRRAEQDGPLRRQ